jgi:hypothetical protein
MRPTVLYSALASVTMLGSVSTSVAAQQREDTPTLTPRVVATYDFGAKRRAIAFPSVVTVADSAGTLVASASIPGSRTEIPMIVTVLDSDLVLQGETVDGVLTMVLDRQNEGGATQVTTGRWTLGAAEGSLRGQRRK